MFSKNFMQYLISYQTDEAEQNETKKEEKKESKKRPSMADLIGSKEYAPVGIKYFTE